MAQQAPYQGANKCTVHSITTNAFDAAVFTLIKTVDSTIEGHPVKEDLKITLASKANDESFNTFIKTYMSAKEVTTKKLTYEDGTIETIVSGTSTADTVGVIWYDGAVLTKRKVIVGAAVLTGATGNTKTVYGDIGDAPVELQFVDWGASLTAASNLFDTALVSGAADVVLASGEVGCVLFLTAA